MLSEDMEEEQSVREDNIVISSLSDIGNMIANRAEECRNNCEGLKTNNSPRSHSSNDHIDTCNILLTELGISNVGEYDSERDVSSKSCSRVINVWSPEGYESPTSQSQISTTSKEWHPFSEYDDTFGFDNDEEDKDDECNNYFNWDAQTEGQSKLNIIEMLSIQGFKQQVLESIPKCYLDISLIYICRINVSQEDKYYYTIGFTRDIEKSLETIDDTYSCEWKIEILALIRSSSQNDEVRIKYELLQMGININNNLYDILEKIYTYITFKSVYVNPFYVIDKDNNESYLGKKITHMEHTSEHIE